MASKKKTDQEIPNQKFSAQEPTQIESFNGFEAIVNEKTRYSTVNAFSGFEYVRYEFRPVPKGYEEQAKKHPYLTVRPRTKSALAEMVQPATDQNPDALEVLPVGGAPAQVDEESPVTQVTDADGDSESQSDSGGAPADE